MATPTGPATDTPGPSVSIAPSPTASTEPATLQTIDVPSRVAPWAFGQSGALIAFSYYDDGRELVLADFLSGALAVLATAEERQVMDVAVSGAEVAWVDGAYDGYRDLVPCGNQGGVKWHVKLTDASSGQTTEVASGHQRDVAGLCAADAPQVALDGDLIAYAAEHPTSDYPHGWRIAVIDNTTGETVRTVQTQHGVYDLQLDHGDIAYVEGSYPKGGDFDPTTWVMVSRTTDLEPVLIQKDSDYVAFQDGRLAWSACDDAGCQTMSSPAVELVPAVVGGPGWPGPAATADSVFYLVNDVVDVWSSASDEVSLRDVIRPSDAFAANDDWFGWAGHVDDGQTRRYVIGAIPLEQLVAVH